MIGLSPNDACLMTAPRMRPPVWHRDKKFHRVLLIGRKFSALDLVSLILWRIDCGIWLKNSFSEFLSGFPCGGFPKQICLKVPFLFYRIRYLFCSVLWTECGVFRFFLTDLNLDMSINTLKNLHYRICIVLSTPVKSNIW